jgi:5-methylcytosine-specific restriction enzyme subunit McrC
MRQVTVREYARLGKSDQPTDTESLDRAEVSASAFDYLCELQASFRSSGANLLHIDGAQKLRLDQYVGVIETPCGTRLEILPKHLDDNDALTVGKARALLIKMLNCALKLKPREVGMANLALHHQPLHEWLIREFLCAFETLLSKGIRSEYLRTEETQKYLRGQLDIAKHIRQPPTQAHVFPIRHDVFSLNRPENRLLRLALERICRITQEPQNWRLAQELRLLTSEIPASANIQQDFSRWQSGRLLAHYQPIRPWCELVLGQHLPITGHSHWRGMSLLFPMDRLFEAYVADHLKKQLITQATIRTQVRTEYLCSHQEKPIFQLRPDLVINWSGSKENSSTVVLDTKWKRVNNDDQEKRYGLKDSDLQQMFAYSYFYLQHQGDVILIYPKSDTFTKPLEPFYFNTPFAEMTAPAKKARLLVLPFDLEQDTLIQPDTKLEWLGA